METGATVFATTATMEPGALAQRLEERGHSALYFAEHTHLPASEHTARLPHAFRSTFDPFVVSTAAALATRRLRVGSAICLVAQHDPIVLAKTIASVDQLSGGRVDFGVGGGWVEEEMAHHGVAPARRFARMREHVEAIRTIWREDEASYRGPHVSFERIWSWPKPVQWPHPPVLVGGMGPKVLDRVLAYGDGWLPDYANAETFERTLRRVAELRSRAADAGRGRIPVVLAGVPHDPEVLERCEAAGINRVLTLLPAAGGGVVERALDSYERAIADWRGE
ncbi:LLM class F420-dependent oxidoreductase [Streptomyces sp. UNOB3_S3]|uniref:LLM class F420-dependent oxidoreductase n=1 Tax=Streptomyces sp. UNOB3_S3 TaxID=2871682 RepID=UPI001E39BBC3|nr:LLM class F420-dependent oxidoreductase [Streptomyces sp. UNOB3_S3]MCC3774242.1 LLM class F420-dependent oxidoreductase [Streptomyces sp. UNOB3_S3]